MINLNFSISNPWSTRWKTLFCKHGLFWSANKAWEFNGYATHHIVDLSFELRQGRVDHPGVFLMIGLVGYAIEFQIYDTRHWDNQWGVWR
jgi:hypothetical protein